ncbi:hypothetical protein [Phaffia rhodozyma]|uniref:Uncharacterized protein n=1 Tax=Phaffia rhodozyma TaxID=264483 RepID=A0A0F7SW88_PHARH|nr:hypothetical protein [Phaffia rhodozyma]
MSELLRSWIVSSGTQSVCWLLTLSPPPFFSLTGRQLTGIPTTASAQNVVVVDSRLRLAHESKGTRPGPRLCVWLLRPQAFPKTPVDGQVTSLDEPRWAGQAG